MCPDGGIVVNDVLDPEFPCRQWWHARHHRHPVQAAIEEQMLLSHTFSPTSIASGETVTKRSAVDGRRTLVPMSVALRIAGKERYYVLITE